MGFAPLFQTEAVCKGNEWEGRERREGNVNAGDARDPSERRQRARTPGVDGIPRSFALEPNVCYLFTMKTMSLWRLLLVPLVSTIAATSFAASASNVRIDFVNPKSFTDIRIHGFNEFKSADIFADEMTKALSPIVAKEAPGCTLVLQFTNIDLGGRYQPWKGPQKENIRYEKQWLPLQMTFNYTLLDARGKPISQGTKTLYDTLYLGWSVGGYYWENWDYLYFERRDLTRWVERNVRAGQPGLTKGA